MRCSSRFFKFLEREGAHLSRFLANPTVGFLRVKKQSGSKQRGQRVGISFLEF